MKFEDLLREYNVQTMASGHEHCRPGWIQVDCPFCTPHTQHFRMGYNLYGRYVNCWACGRHDLTETLTLLANIPWGRAKDLLKDIERGRTPKKLEERGKLELPKYLEDLGKAHRKYLMSRGYDVDELIKLWEIKGIGPLSNLKWRVFIPIAYQDRIVSWTTRSISDQVTLRYQSAKRKQEEINHKTLLYGEHYCRHSIIIVEGPLDVWKIGPGAAGTCGTGFSRAQVLKMSKYPTRAVCFDAERQAQKRARELCDLLETFPGRTYNVELDSKDPGEATKKEIDQLRRSFLE